MNYSTPTPDQDGWWAYLKRSGYTPSTSVTFAGSVASYLRWIAGGMVDPEDENRLNAEADRIEREVSA